MPGPVPKGLMTGVIGLPPPVRSPLPAQGPRTDPFLSIPSGIPPVPANIRLHHLTRQHVFGLFCSLRVPAGTLDAHFRALLCYSPHISGKHKIKYTHASLKMRRLQICKRLVLFSLVRTRRFELRTSCLSSKRSKPTELCPQKDCKDRQKNWRTQIFLHQFTITSSKNWNSR